MRYRFILMSISEINITGESTSWLIMRCDSEVNEVKGAEGNKWGREPPAVRAFRKQRLAVMKWRATPTLLALRLGTVSGCFGLAQLCGPLAMLQTGALLGSAAPPKAG